MRDFIRLDLTEFIVQQVHSMLLTNQKLLCWWPANNDTHLWEVCLFNIDLLFCFSEVPTFHHFAVSCLTIHIIDDLWLALVDVYGNLQKSNFLSVNRLFVHMLHLTPLSSYFSYPIEQSFQCDLMHSWWSWCLFVQQKFDGTFCLPSSDHEICHHYVCLDSSPLICDLWSSFCITDSCDIIIHGNRWKLESLYGNSFLLLVQTLAFYISILQVCEWLKKINLWDTTLCLERILLCCLTCFHRHSGVLFQCLLESFWWILMTVHQLADERFSLSG